MKTISFRLTDKQHHYLAAVAKDQMRSVEQLVWMGLSEGIPYMFTEETYCVDKLQCDYTDEDRESMAKYPLATPCYGTQYYGDHPWAEEIRGNVLADIEHELEQADSFDLQAEITRTNGLHAQRKQDYEAKEAAKKEEEAAKKEQEAAQ
jgi:hypothetical protein